MAGVGAREPAGATATEVTDLEPFWVGFWKAGHHQRMIGSGVETMS
jgi:hypothetical protein